jgi:hydrogenase nickel incorporation protein HypA/HybF
VHERGLMRDVIRRVEDVAAAEGSARVTRIAVRLGALSHFTADHFREHFEDAARGTVAESAIVDAVVEDDVANACAREVLLESIELEL